MGLNAYHRVTSSNYIAFFADQCLDHSGIVVIHSQRAACREHYQAPQKNDFQTFNNKIVHGKSRYSFFDYWLNILTTTPAQALDPQSTDEIHVSLPLTSAVRRQPLDA